jgi:hypothetical protein
MAARGTMHKINVPMIDVRGGDINVRIRDRSMGFQSISRFAVK